MKKTFCDICEREIQDIYKVIVPYNKEIEATTEEGCKLMVFELPCLTEKEICVGCAKHMADWLENFKSLIKERSKNE